MPKQDPQIHRQHQHALRPTDHIKNVPHTRTHDLLACSCGFYGWVEKQEEA